MTKQESKIDYSRTQYVFGKEALERMQNANFFIFGADGTAAEIAKNIMLTGCSVSINDTSKVSMLDFCSNPFLASGDIGKQRGQVVVNAVKELNSQKAVSHEVITDLAQLKQYQVVIYCYSQQYTAIQIDDFCHNNNIPFVLGQTFGLCGRVFCDFGAQFTIHDVDGERIEDFSVSEMMLDKNNNKYEMFIGCKSTLPYDNGFLVKITDLKFRVLDGKQQEIQEYQDKLSKCFNEKSYRILVVNPRMIQVIIEQSVEFLNLLEEIKSKQLQVCYFRGGYLQRVKESVQMAFLSLTECYKKETLPCCEFMTDFTKFENNAVYREIYQFLDKQKCEYIEQYNKPWNPQQFQQFYNDLHKNSTNKSVLENAAAKSLIQYFIGQNHGQFSPVSSIIGGWAAQEALIAVSGKYTPIQQFWFFDAFECLKQAPIEQDCQPTNTRYDGQIVIFGKQIQQKIVDQSLFVVGAGALGCEILKFVALAGACSKNKLDVTDLDSIENSNLSRQFLFRERDTGKMKSFVAAERAQIINPDCKINPLTTKICSANPLANQFWFDKSIIINALDNIETRKFVDKKCVQFEKPLLESGTLGHKANSQVIVPRLTQIYSATQDPDTGEAPACTIHNFPSNITHCIVYATSEYKGIFESAVEDLIKWQQCQNDNDVSKFVSHLKEDLSTLKGRFARLLQFVQSPIQKIEDCYKFAFCQFKRFFVKMIARLLELNPIDSKNSDGSPFWQGEKRPPTTLQFDFNDANHLQFLQSCSKICADVYQIKYEFNMDAAQLVFKQCYQQLDVTTADEAGNLVDQAEEKLQQLIVAKFQFKPEIKTDIKPIPLEKDDPANKHIEFIAAFSNLRAQNYEIPNINTDEVRRIAGNIIPAMITTTAAIVGHIGVEFLKLVQKFDKIEDYKQVFMNFALPTLQISENENCTSYKLGETDKIFTVWDYVDMKGDPTIQQVIDYVQEKYETAIDGIMSGTKSIYMGFMDDDAKKLRKIKEILTELQVPFEDEIILTLIPEGDGDVPALRFRK